MKENKYDDLSFFNQYSRMNRSVLGLEGAGEWHELKKLLPDFQGKKLLDLGCGFGWHCRYALEQGAQSALGIDISSKMIAEACRRNSLPGIRYRCQAIEEYEFPENEYDVVISSLAFHYLESFGTICNKTARTLCPGGTFVFSVEHPVFTAYGTQDWHYDSQGKILHWPVDRYFSEGERRANFLGEEIIKYHKTLSTYVNELIRHGFRITHLCEPQPDPQMLDTIPGMRDELRRPMMLILSASLPAESLR